VNSKALELAKVTRTTLDPEGGRIERNAQGEPSGTLRESAAGLVEDLAPDATPEERIAGLQKALEIMNGFGITGFNDASVSKNYLDTYLEADRKNLLTARVAASIHADPQGDLEAPDANKSDPAGLPKVLAQVEVFKQWREKYHGDNLKAGTVKIFEDGVIEANTAAMLQPYLDKPNDRGKLLWKPEILNPFVAMLDREGFQVHFHAIGDGAVRTALDALEAARKTNGAKDARPFLAHIQVIDPADIPRFVKIGASPCFQALWAYEDDYITDLTLPKLARDRWPWIYPIASVVKTGAVMSMGSDWNVSSVNPLDAIEVAVTRRSPNNEPDSKPVFLPEQRIDVGTALAAYTIGSAWSQFWENETGSLETGKSADLIVLSENPFEIDPAKLSDVKVLLTLFKGKTVYRAKDM
jgi:predicted amidohydrolase YtcJ